MSIRLNGSLARTKIRLSSRPNFAAPYVAGNVIRTSPTSRLQIRGVAVTAITKTNDAGSNNYANSLYAHRDQIFAAVKAAGYTAVRIFTNGSLYVNQTFESSATNLAKIKALVDSANRNGLYVMLCDYAMTGVATSQIDSGTYKNYFPFIDALCAQFNSSHGVFYEMWNEPSINAATQAQWVLLHTDTIARYRAAGYTGLLVCNARNFGELYDPTGWDQIIAADSNVAFSQHLYIPYDTAVGGEAFLGSAYVQPFEQTWAVGCATYPIIESELGDYSSDFTPGHDVSYPTFATQIADRIGGLYSRGHNGAFAFEWSWYDYGTMAGTADGNVKTGTESLNTEWGTPITASLTAAWGGKPPGQTQFTTVTVSGSTIVLNWYAVCDATGYTVTRDGTQIYSGAALTYTDTPGDTNSHTYVVTATNSNGNGPASPSYSAQVDSRTYMQRVQALSGLIAAWPLTSDVSDVSGNSHTGSVVGSVPFTTTNQFGGGSATFSGSASNRLTVPDAADLRLNGALTIAFWAKMTTTTLFPAIMSKGANSSAGNWGYTIFEQASVPKYVFQRNGTAVSTNTVTAGAWHLIVFTCDASGNWVWYVDGAVSTSGTSAGLVGTTNADTTALSIGSNATSNPFLGAIDGVAFVGRAITSTEVASLFAATS